MAFIDEWYKTAKEVILRPMEFFKTMPTTGGFGEPLKFALINIVITLILTAVILTEIPNTIPGLQLKKWTAIYGAETAGITWTLMTLISGIIYIFILSGIYHLLLKLFGAKERYEATFRVVAYITVFNIFSTISLIEMTAAKIVSFLITLYVLYLMVLGFRDAHKISSLRAAIVVLLPIIIIMTLIIIWAILYI
ncbi:MAG: hypothetical protein DRN71_04415 [Candidatus Nanohalarchaeota archaeon]|nr:MAG: hypothetical protein DRN71_04415 [Candidatus Nanohaloarchaeota archaeon]